MSLPRVECTMDRNTDPLKITFTFKGACECPGQNLAHAIDPSVTTVAKKIRIMQEKKKEEEKEENEHQTKKKNLMKRRREEFAEKGRLMALYGALERKVQCASMCTDHLLLQKRDKLRKILLAEEEAYAKEYVAMCQAASEAKEEELRKKAVELKAKLEQDRKEFAEMKIRELKIQDCEPARPIRSKKALLATKQDQLWQIKEKYAMEEARREEDRMYHDLMIKNLMEMRLRDEEDAKILWVKQKQIRENFAEQLKWREERDKKEKALKEFEKKQLEETLRMNKEAEEKEFEEKRARNAQKIAEYQEYMEREKEIRERRKKEEEEIDRTFTRLMQMEEEKEKQKITSDKIRLRQEMDFYIRSCQELRRLRDLEEQKNDELLEELNKKIKAQQDAKRMALRNAKRELFQNMLKERAEQVRAKRERERREEEARNQEIELLHLQIEQQRKIREEYERRCEKKREEYGRILKEQMMEQEEIRKRRKQEEEEFNRQLRIQDEQKRKEVEDILETSVSLPMHPMKKYIQRNPPHYEKPFPCPP